MTYQLFLGDPTYSSWSLRGWLLFEHFNLPVETIWVDFITGSVAEKMAIAPPAKTVPTLRCPDGAVIWESLAIAEELASRHPEAGLWPSDPVARATARSLAAEMHSGFSTLRNDCPMHLQAAYRDVPVSPELDTDLRRLERIWEHARGLQDDASPWLCGSYSAADAFFAPVAARIAGYGLNVSDRARTYVDAHLADPSFRRWRALGHARGPVLPWYERDYPRRDWPGPAPLPARAVESGTAKNTACPFSGRPVTHLAEVQGRVLGFCNAVCRDKVVADPAVWPEVMALLDG
ncbi:glutathione S-transferase [Tropicimonas sp. TH_r6]|uniref:glutathione S-transferase n=1 Tax=Tropicimonas sp. TH_r6 TaxID=3082085 RepID=UPI00295583D6|nr:glutathione S-transferase [Tropicimonas sp. TH_r6]MDV7142212.1 glutathione S-transferase [Tropicimonas sp. TH_r6]